MTRVVFAVGSRGNAVIAAEGVGKATKMGERISEELALDNLGGIKKVMKKVISYEKGDSHFNYCHCELFSMDQKSK